VDCQPNCVDKDCGDDGCGGSCGTCTAPKVCDDDGKCVDCTPNCTDKVCGDDGCEGSCGTCPADKHCEDGACVAGTSGNPGDPCTFGDVNVDAGDCNTGGTCLGIEADGQSGTCTIASDCTNLGDELNPDCVNGNCGASFCAEECPGGDVNQCPAGFVGQVISGTCFCVPSSDPIGPGEKGDPCIFGDVNSDTENCKEEFACLGLAADGTSGTCTVDADCSDLGDALNPDCVSGNCGASFCAEQCPGGVAANCPAGTTGQDISGTCYCIPSTGPVGNADKGDPCIFGDVNADTDNCKAEFACLGLPADGTSGTCTVDADCSDLGDAINPDCVSGNCGASFCAEQCPGGVAANCPAGTTGQDVGGTCYCIPS